MRILHVTPSLCPTFGGPSRGVPELSRALVKAGLSVDVVSTNDGDSAHGVPLNVPLEEQGVRTRYFAKQNSSGSYGLSWGLTRWLWKHIGDYDLIHTHMIFSYPTLATSRLASRMKRPYVVTPHGMVDPWCLGYKGWKKRPYMRLVENRTLSGSAALHALVTEERHYLDALNLASPTFVLPNGVHLEDFYSLPRREVFERQYRKATGKKIVLFMGRIDPKKGLDLLVKAFARIIRGRERQDLCLVVAGPDLIGYQATIERLVEDEKIQEHVIFTGMISGEMKLAALSAADLFVLPSHSEGFSMAVLEALASACPVIITEACNFPEVASAQCGEVIPTDLERLTEALRTMLQNEDRRREMGERGRELVRQRYSWTTIATRMTEVYEDILRRRRQSNAWNS